MKRGCTEPFEIYINMEDHDLSDYSFSYLCNSLPDPKWIPFQCDMKPTSLVLSWDKGEKSSFSCSSWWNTVSAHPLVQAVQNQTHPPSNIEHNNQNISTLSSQKKVHSSWCCGKPARSQELPKLNFIASSFILLP